MQRLEVKFIPKTITLPQTPMIYKNNLKVLFLHVVNYKPETLHRLPNPSLVPRPSHPLLNEIFVSGAGGRVRDRHYLIQTAFDRHYRLLL